MTTDGMLPSLIVIGAMKASTSSLHNYLAAHPAVAVSHPKELDFFLPDHQGRGLDWYRHQFVGSGSATVAIEASPNYTKAHEFPGVPERIAQVLPNVKLVYLVRDPFDRIASHWRHMVGAGRVRDDFHGFLHSPAADLAVNTSRYWWQLSKFVDHFPSDQIRVIDTKDLHRDTAGTVNHLLGWIGLPGGFEHEVFTKVSHRGDNMVRPNALGRWVWRRDRIWRQRAQRAVPWLVGSRIPRAEWTEEDRAMIAEVLAPDAAELRRFTDLALSSWPV